MGLFSKKPKADVQPNPLESQQTAVNVKKNRKDTMASVLRESVLEVSLEELRNNKLFVTERNGQKLYVGIKFRAADIGGLSKRTNKDEAKGSMVESINNGRIKVLITSEMMANEEVIIIPDVYTCDAMDEYSILTEAPYTFAFIDDAGNVEMTDYKVSFDEIKNLVETDGDINQLLFSHGVDFAKIQAGVPTEFEDYWTDGEADEEEGLDDDIPFEDEIPDDDVDDDMPSEDDIPDDMSDEDIPDEDISDEEEDAPEIADVNDDADDYDEDDSEDETTDEVSPAAFEDAIVRKFYSDNLGLSVTTEPFDAQFMHANTYVSFDENRGEGWVNQYLNEMSKNANIEMERMHKANLVKMRDLYYKLIAMHCEQIQKDLDSDNASTEYGQVMIKLNQQRSEQQKNIDADIASRRKELDEQWNEKLEQVGKDAAVEARQQYVLRFGRQHESDMEKAATVIQTKFEDEYQDGVRQVNERRRADAAKRLDYGITETLSEISKMYMKCLDEEQSLYRKQSEKIAQFLEENRKEDIAQREVVEKQLKESKEAERLMNEYKSNLEAMTSEFEAKKTALNAEVEAAKREAAAMVEKKEEEWNARIEDMKSDMKKKQTEFDDLLDKYAELDDRKGKEYESRINELKNQCDSWEDKCNHIESVNKRNGSIGTSLVIVAVVAALAIGMLFGLFINVNKFAEDNATQPVSQVYTYEEQTTVDNTEQQTTQPQAENNQ